MMIVVFLATVAAVTAQDLQPKCCFDKQFSGIVGRIGGIFSDQSEKLLDETTILGYDFYTQRMATESYLRGYNDTLVKIYELRDFAARKHYLKVDDNPCSEVPLVRGAMLPPCIPGDATLLSATTMGYGYSSLEVDIWEFGVLDVNGDPYGRVKLGVTKGNCVPVIDIFMGTYNGTFYEMNQFLSAYQPGIVNVDAFNLPADCAALQ